MIVNKVIIKKMITSSSITTTGIDITDNAYGEFLIRNVIIKSDGTGLAGGTNIQVVQNSTFGNPIIFQETVANLGANKTIDLSSASVTKQLSTLDSGNKISIKSTVGNCTGAGVIELYIELEKLDQGASVNLV